MINSPNKQIVLGSFSGVLLPLLFLCVHVFGVGQWFVVWLCGGHRFPNDKSLNLDFCLFLISFGFLNSLHSKILKDHKTLFMILPSQETKYVHFYSM